MSTPIGCQTVTPYLIIPNAKSFIEFTQKVFGATIKENHEDDKGVVIHAQIEIGNSSIMIGTSSEQWGAQPAGLFVYVDNADISYQLALDKGATSVMPPADQSYGRSCGVNDTWGNTWWITSTK